MTQTTASIHPTTWQDYKQLAETPHTHVLVKEFYYGKALQLLSVEEDSSSRAEVLSCYNHCKFNTESSLSKRVIHLVNIEGTECWEDLSILTDDFTLNWSEFTRDRMLDGFVKMEEREVKQPLTTPGYINDTDDQMFAHCAQYIKTRAILIDRELRTKWNTYCLEQNIGDTVIVDDVKQFLTSCLPYYKQNQFQMICQSHLMSHFVYEHLVKGRSSILCFMSAISYLEHALQDLVYQGMNKVERELFLTHLPKINDLLLRPDLEKILGLDRIFLFRAFFGPLNSLNLRNVTMHGFISGGFTEFRSGDEFSPSYTSFLLVLIASLNDFVQPWILQQQNENKPIMHQPILKLDRLRQDRLKQELAIVNPNSFLIEDSIVSSLKDSVEMSKLEELLSRSAFILPEWKDNWMHTICTYYLADHGEQTLHYYNFCVLIFPLLEHCIRRVFVSVNNCADRLLTAERNSYYTTLDILLSTVPSTYLPDSTNCIFNDLGSNLTNALFDLLIWPESLRIRDLIAHGNIDPFTIDREVADELLGVCLALCAHYDPDNTGYSARYIESLPEIVRYSVNFYRDIYEPAFHAFHATERAIKDACIKLHEFELFAKENMAVTDSAEIAEAKRIVNQLLLKVTSSLNVNEEALAQYRTTPTDHRVMAQVNLSEKEVKKLHVLRRTARSCESTCTKIQELYETMKEKIQARKAKERERESFALLPRYLDTYSLLLKLCCFIAYTEYYNRTEQWENQNKLSIAGDKTASNIYSFVKSGKWQRAFDSIVAIFLNTDKPAVMTSLGEFKFHSMSMKEAKRLYLDFEALVASK